MFSVMSRFRGRQRRPRGQSSWYDSSMSALADQAERMEIPPEKVGLVIGRQGRRLKEIREEHVAFKYSSKILLLTCGGQQSRFKEPKTWLKKSWIRWAHTLVVHVKEHRSLYAPHMFNPRMYTQIHTPTVAGTRRGVLEPLPRVFDMLQYFETISTSVESLWSSLQDELYFMGAGAAGSLWRHQQWPSSWILQRIRNQVKTARNGNFFMLDI